MTSWPTAVFVWLTVTVMLGAPTRNAWILTSPPDAFRTPMLTENSSFGESVVGAVDRPDSCRPTSPTVAVLCACVKPGAVAVSVTVPWAPSTP